MNNLGSLLEIVFAISLDTIVAARPMYPPVKAFPKHKISGVTFACSNANNFPVLPNPVAISSRISRTSYFLQSFFIFSGIRICIFACHPRPVR
ncbi:MAG: hypothetical protein CM15mP93_07760 [Thiotrichaceae bacterium]|nr:MAG: hypothetical protein CM15mP93_07760 [Thiotrichaceae bacterium]